MNRSLVKASVLASALFIILSSLDAYIAVPLRETSSWLAYWAMQVGSFPIEKNGTLLSTPRMTFDVIPACSGSTTLRVMLFIGILWAGMQTGLSSIRKGILILMVLPIALIANAIRVSSLVIMGHMVYKPVEGVLHEATGIVTFLLSFISLVGMTTLLQTNQSDKQSNSNGKFRSIALLLFAALLFAPTALWFWQGWMSSPLDKGGFLYFTIATAGIFWTIHKIEVKTPRRLVSVILITSIFVILVIAIVAEINTLKAIALLTFICAVIIAYRGTKTAIYTLPMFILAALGIPTVSFAINKILATIGLPSSVIVPQLLKVIVALIVITLWYRLLPKAENHASKRLGSENKTAINTLLGLCIILLAVKTFYTDNKIKTIDHGKIELSYMLGNWRGINNGENDDDSNTILKNSWMRKYKNGIDEIQVIITSSGGNRHNLHPPEYCLTGSGWKLSNEVKKTINGHIATQMTMKKSEQTCYFLYWFSDGEQVFANYRSMLKQDTIRRFQGRNTKWFLFRIFSESHEALTVDFIPHFKGRFIIDNKSFEFGPDARKSSPIHLQELSDSSSF